MSAAGNGAYSGVGKLMANYGWVQNTSNLSLSVIPLSWYPRMG